MLNEPDFLITARDLANEPLARRFNTKNLILAFFLEAYATGFLRVVAGKKYTGIRAIPLVDEDIKGGIREKLDPMMADIGTSVFAPHADWIEANLSVGQLMEFLALCNHSMSRRFLRRIKETRTIMGGQMLAFFMANVIRFGIVIAAFDLGAYWMLLLLVLTMLLAAVVVTKGTLKLT